MRTPALLATLLLSIGVGIGSNVVVHGFAKGLTVGDDDTARIAEPLPFDERDAVQRLDGLLGIAAGLVLVIALGNVASLLIGRSAARAHETSMRLALGASRAQLARRVLVESLAIAVVGAALGILVSAWMTAAIPALLYVEDAAQLQFVPDRAEIALIVAACSSVTIACWPCACAFDCERDASGSPSSRKCRCVSSGGAGSPGAADRAVRVLLRPGHLRGSHRRTPEGGAKDHGRARPRQRGARDGQRASERRACLLRRDRARGDERVAAARRPRLDRDASWNATDVAGVPR